jgi:hypothetical protein
MEKMWKADLRKSKKEEGEDTSACMGTETR